MDRRIEKKRFTVKNIAKVSIPSAFFLVVLYMIIFGDKSSKYNVDTERISISTVYESEFQEYIPALGTVVPIQRYTLSATEGGVVEERVI